MAVKMLKPHHSGSEHAEADLLSEYNLLKEVMIVMIVMIVMMVMMKGTCSQSTISSNRSNLLRPIYDTRGMGSILVGSGGEGKGLLGSRS